MRIKVVKDPEVGLVEIGKVYNVDREVDIEFTGGSNDDTLSRVPCYLVVLPDGRKDIVSAASCEIVP